MNRLNMLGVIWVTVEPLILNSLQVVMTDRAGILERDEEGSGVHRGDNNGQQEDIHVCSEEAIDG